MLYLNSEHFGSFYNHKHCLKNKCTIYTHTMFYVILSKCAANLIGKLYIKCKFFLYLINSNECTFLFSLLENYRKKWARFGLDFSRYLLCQLKNPDEINTTHVYLLEKKKPNLKFPLINFCRFEILQLEFIAYIYLHFGCPVQFAPQQFYFVRYTYQS